MKATASTNPQTTNGKEQAIASQQSKLARWRAIANLPDVKTRLDAVQLPPERLVQLIYLAETRQPQLAQCSELSLVNCLIKANELGLNPTGTLGQAYLVPFWDNQSKKLHCQLIIGYQGLVHLARKSGKIKKIEARVVREGDEFIAEYGTNPKIIHKPDIFASGNPVAVYAIATFADGGQQFEIMSISQVEKIKNRAKAKGENTPWQTDFEEMAKKTVVRRLCKYLPLNPELEKAFEADDDGVEPKAKPIAAEIKDMPEEKGGVDALKEIIGAQDVKQKEERPADASEPQQAKSGLYE